MLLLSRGVMVSACANFDMIGSARWAGCKELLVLAKRLRSFFRFVGQGVMDKPEAKQRAETPLDTVAEFQRRRRLATRLGAPFLVSTYVSVIALIVLSQIDMESSPILKINLMVFFFLVGFASWGLHLYFDSKYNRCPNCEHVPIDSRGKVIVDPVRCPRCGARLREYDSLFF